MPLSKIQFAESLGRRRLNINGGMVIAQRGTAAVTVTSGYQVVDKSYTAYSHDGAVTKEQSTDVPVGEGFSHSLKSVVTTADTSIAASQYHDVYQYRFEANEMTQLGYGTSGAKKSALSFFVKSSVAGAYNGTITNQNNSCKLPFTFTIAAANTWQRIRIENIPAITTGSDNGTAWLTTGINFGGSIRIYGSLGSNWTGATDKVWNTAGDNNAFGSATNVNWLATVGNTFYITGFQWEVNERCSDFEHRDFAEELASCQRYCQLIKTSDGYPNYNGHVNASGGSYIVVPFTVDMRTPPTGITVTNVGSWGHVVYGVLNQGCTSITFGTASSKTISLDVNGGSGFTLGHGSMLYDGESSGNVGVIEFTGAEV